jgi:hypothetical protein
MQSGGIDFASLGRKTPIHRISRRKLRTERSQDAGFRMRISLTHQTGRARQRLRSDTCGFAVRERVRREWNDCLVYTRNKERYKRGSKERGGVSVSLESQSFQEVNTSFAFLLYLLDFFEKLRHVLRRQDHHLFRSFRRLDSRSSDADCSASTERDIRGFG